MSKTKQQRKQHDTFSRWGEARNLAAKFCMTAEDVRDAIQMWHDIVNDIGIKPTQQAAEIKDLRKMLYGKQLIKRQTGLEIMASDEAPSNTMELRQVVDVRDAWREVQLAYALGDFKELCQKIDLFASKSLLRDLPRDLEGLDEELGALVTRLTGVARGSSLSSTTLQLLNQYAGARIEGIQRVIHDKENGDYLRKVVAQSSNDLRDQATAAINKARQGRKTEPLTDRIREYAKTFYYDHNEKYKNNKRTWERAGRAIADDLYRRGARLDKLDQQIWNEIKDKEPEKQGEYFKNRWHG